jgi:hypothetical protein
MNLAPLLDRTNRIAAPDAIQPTGLDAQAAWMALEESTTAFRTAIKEGDGLALSAISMTHPLFGSLSLYQYIAFAGAHEARHAAQIREIAATLASST